MAKFNLFKILASTLLILTLSSKLTAESVVSRFELLSGIKQTDRIPQPPPSKLKGRDTYIYGKSPEQFLVDNYHYIPAGSRVLDIHMGDGQHTVFLAQKGYRVVGIEQSSLAIKKVKFLASEFEVRVDTIQTKINSYHPKGGPFDAIISFFRVERSLLSKISSWLKPGGILIYHAFTNKQLGKKEQAVDIKHQTLLRPKELLTLFPGMTILKYEEPVHLNNYTASIILKNN
ncbi:MAG: methyltransferase domain-containing protein [Bdellovibrionales bacterium]|nr:methyltransferase domain-containing protein [Bdellovibrionales bacterium]